MDHRRQVAEYSAALDEAHRAQGDEVGGVLGELLVVDRAHVSLRWRRLAVATSLVNVPEDVVVTVPSPTDMRIMSGSTPGGALLRFVELAVVEAGWMIQRARVADVGEVAHELDAFG